METEQQQKFVLGESNRPAHRNHDYIDLFPYGIFPTGDIDLLERGGNMLVIKSYEWGRLDKMPKPHTRIWKMLSGPLYSNPDAPGDITVVCVEGLGVAPRRFIVFDHQGEHPVKVGTIDEWREWLSDWLKDNKRRR